jgi:AcrR family transcriptional regulator
MAGRPRDLALEKRLLGAAWSLLVEEGYEALTLTQVAARANAHRSDVYRRWSSKAQLVSDTLAEHLPAVSAFDTGALRSDLQAYVDDLAVSWSSSWIDGLVGWLADLNTDTEAEAAFRAFATSRGKNMRNAIERAVDRGELGEVSEFDLILLAELLEGPLMHRRLLGRRALKQDYLEAVAEAAYGWLLRTSPPK